MSVMSGEDLGEERKEEKNGGWELSGRRADERVTSAAPDYLELFPNANSIISKVTAIFLLF